MLPVPEWTPIGEYKASARIQKTSGRIYWNEILNQYLGRPESIMLEYDAALKWLGIRKDSYLSVVKDEDGNFYVDAKEALEEIGFEFPLDENLTFEPAPPTDNLNRVILELE